jgi:hypothetical protein
MDEFYKVSNETHDSETNGDSLADLGEFYNESQILQSHSLG